jgi:hypothetical protein
MADVVCACARIMVGSSVSVVLLVVSAWVDRVVVCVCARIVGSSVSVVGGEFIVGNYVPLSWVDLINISVIGFVRVPFVVQV